MKRIITPWADSGTKNTVPDTAIVPDVGIASYPIGFTPKNATPLTAGGVPVSEGDMNGVLNDVTDILAQNARGIYFAYNATFSTAISGYPVNAVLVKTGAIGYWLNTTAGNTTNPDTGGAGWIDFSPKAMQNGDYTYAGATGTANEITATYSPAYTAWVDGMTFFAKITAANTTATPTVSPNGLTAKTIVKGGGEALRASDLIEGMIAEFKYNSTLDKVILQNPNLTNIAVPVGTILPYSSAVSAPHGYIFANGAALSRTAYADLFKLWVTDQGFTAQTFTVTIAAPAVFTKIAHNFTNGERLRLSTTGALPTGLNKTTDYFVEKIDANTFYLTTSFFGVATRVTTTGTQSGTHTYLQSIYGLGDGSTTFNAPDPRGLALRGLDAGRGIDTGRTIGTAQKGTLQFIDTNTNGTPDGIWSLSTNASATLSMAQSTLGVDGYSTTDYPYIAIGGVAPTTTSTLPGVAGTQYASGVSRPSNIAFPFIIKY